MSPYDPAKMTAAEAFESEAVQIANRTAAKFQERLAAERAMADTVAMGSDEEVREMRERLDIANSQIKALNALVQQEQKRVEELEAQRDAYAPKAMHDAHDLINRISYVLRTFYYAELSMSSIQPLLQLCCELNPEIVEQKR